jgi:tRNA nucleotidyltransferase (CCA-adding enzyme)
VLRAVRLEVRLGFQIDPATLTLLDRSRPHLAEVSGERLRNELDVILSDPESGRMVTRLAELHVLPAIHPALDWDGWLEDAFARAGRFDPPSSWGLQADSTARALRYAVWVIRRSMAEAASWADRLRVSRVERAVWLQANQLFRELPRAIARHEKVSALTARMEAADGLALAAVWLAHAAEPLVVRAVENFLGQWRHVRPRTDGRVLLGLGVPPGPVYRRLIERLRAGWLDGEITSEVQEISCRTEWIAQEGGHG